MVEVGTSSGAVSIASLEASRDQKHFPEFRFFGFKKKSRRTGGFEMPRSKSGVGAARRGFNDK